MKTDIDARQIPAALSYDALIGKSRLFAKRGLAAKSSDPELVQLWASFALELLAKASLAKIHPSLIVEPENPNSLLEANGIHTGTRIRTINARTLYARLKHTVAHFGTPVLKACDDLAERRNLELHCGVAALAEMPAEAWEGNYWNAAELILHSMHMTLDEWLGADSRAPKELLAQFREAKAQSARQRVRHAAEGVKWIAEGKKRSKEQLAALVEQSKALKPLEHINLFRYRTLDRYWLHECPACGAQGILGGDKTFDEPAGDQSGAEYGFEFVELQFSPVEFHCPTCNLDLEGEDALDAVGLDEPLVEWEEREIEYEPDYGND